MRSTNTTRARVLKGSATFRRESNVYTSVFPPSLRIAISPAVPRPKRTAVLCERYDIAVTISRAPASSSFQRVYAVYDIVLYCLLSVHTMVLAESLRQNYIILHARAHNVIITTRGTARSCRALCYYYYYYCDVIILLYRYENEGGRQRSFLTTTKNT